MKHGLTSLALRKTRAHFRAKLVSPIMLGVIFVIGLSGPFGTFETLPLLFRLTYWGCIVVLTYCSAIFVINLAAQVLPKAWPPMLADGVAGAVAGPVITVIVVMMNALVFSGEATSNSLPSVIMLMANCTAISVVVSVLIGQLTSHVDETDTGQNHPPLLRRLSHDKRGALISVQAQDHYVLVTTTKGNQLVLLRIADAISEAAPTRGFQTHRSYWAAQDQIVKSVQHGERGTLTMQDRSKVPVSRKYMPYLKAAGFFV